MKIAPLLLVIILAIAVTLTGCLPGNAEGYGKKPEDDATNGTVPVGQAPSIGTYYLLDPTYTCILPSSGERIPSYRNALALYENTAYLLGDRCKVMSERISLEDLIISSTRQYVGYRDGIYLYIAEPITPALLASLRPIEALCTTLSPSPELVYDVAIRNPIKSGDPLTAHIQFKTADTIVSVDRTETASSRLYVSSVSELEILLNPVNYIFEGRFKMKVTGDPVTEMRCMIFIN